MYPVCPFSIPLRSLSNRVVAPLPVVSTTLQHYSAVGTPKALRCFRWPPSLPRIVNPLSTLRRAEDKGWEGGGGGSTHVTRKASGRMLGQSARAARNVIARSRVGMRNVLSSRGCFSRSFSASSVSAASSPWPEAFRGCTRWHARFNPRSSGGCAIFRKGWNFIRRKVSTSRDYFGRCFSSVNLRDWFTKYMLDGSLGSYFTEV